MSTSETETSTAGFTPLALSPCPISTPPRPRFVLRSDGGFLAASHEVEGPPIRTVPDPRQAFGFSDYTSAVRRARALVEIGWRNLRIVETLIY